MSDEDREAAWQLATEMHWAEGVKFLRDEEGVGLRDAMRQCEALARLHPASRLAESIRARNASTLPSGGEG